MKRIICIILFILIALNDATAKKLPGWVQNRLDSVKVKTVRSLRDYRVWNVDINGGRRTLPYVLGWESSNPVFSYEENQLIDSLGLNLSVGMIYDDEMRDRIIQLIKNEYQEWELDSLANRYICNNSLFIMRDAFADCKFDTLQIFKEALDSFYMDIINKNPKDSAMLKKYAYAEKYQHVDTVFKLLQLDTTTLYKKSHNKVVENEKKGVKEDLLNSTGYPRDYDSLAELCGYINDKRFIQPLIDVLNKLFEFDSAWKESIHKTVIEALVRMRVEPYYSDYVKKRTLTPEQIKDDKWLDFKIEDFVYVLGTQEAFLELSKYLLSSKPYRITIADCDDHSESLISPVSDDAFYLIRDNIKNKEVQEIIGNEYIEDYTPYLKPLYDWMQKNYGKYKIRRIW